jgi:uncharacterized damage-inducible protein DinB
MLTTMPVGELQSLMRHMEWADASVWRTVLTLPEAGQDRRMLDLFHHVHLVQQLYLQLWRGEQPTLTRAEDFADLRAIAEWARPYYADVRSFLQGLRQEDLAREVTFPWADEVARRYGSAGPARLSETILQVVLHSGHHRAQIATRVRELGGESPTTDFIAWIWMQRPDAAW